MNLFLFVLNVRSIFSKINPLKVINANSEIKIALFPLGDSPHFWTLLSGGKHDKLKTLCAYEKNIVMNLCPNYNNELKK